MTGAGVSRAKQTGTEKPIVNAKTMNRAVIFFIMIPPFFIPAHGVTRKNADWYGFIIASLLELFNTYMIMSVSLDRLSFI